MKNLLFAFEVEINRAVGDAGLTRNIGNFGIEITIACKDADRCAQNGTALVGDDRTI